MDNNLRVKGGKLCLHIFNQAPGRQRTSPRNGSGLHVGPMTMTCPFFFMEAVLKQNIANLTLVTPPSWMNHCPRYCPVPLAEPRAYCERNLRRWGVIEMCLLHQAGTCHHCPLPRESLCSARQREDRGWDTSSVTCHTVHSTVF